MTPSRRMGSIAWRGLLLAFAWWAISEGQPASWWLGMPAVLLALVASVMLLPPGTLVWHAWLRFAPRFLVHSLRGGIDVARRALQPGLPIAPAVMDYPLRLPRGLPQVFMANTVSLLPGTLSAALTEDVLTVHLLDGGRDCLAELQGLERDVGRLFGIHPDPAERGA